MLHAKKTLVVLFLLITPLLQTKDENHSWDVEYRGLRYKNREIGFWHRLVLIPYFKKELEKSGLLNFDCHIYYDVLKKSFTVFNNKRTFGDNLLSIQLRSPNIFSKPWDYKIDCIFVKAYPKNGDTLKDLKNNPIMQAYFDMKPGEKKSVMLDNGQWFTCLKNSNDSRYMNCSAKKEESVLKQGSCPAKKILRFFCWARAIRIYKPV